MNYEMEELVPIVAKLAQKYNGMASSSISFEKAEQLMEAVIYCISELEQDNVESSDTELNHRKNQSSKLVTTANLPAKKAYELGYQRVVEKVKETLAKYHNVIDHFRSYGNIALNDTVKKGLPEFFKWYDVRFCPQDTILTLDYPILQEMDGLSGIDAIAQYVRCINLEQQFLGSFDDNYVELVLERYHENYRELVENLCWIVLTDVIGHVLAGKPLKEQHFTHEELDKVQAIVQSMDQPEIKILIKKVMKQLTVQYFEGKDEMLWYLSLSCDDISFRLKNAAQHGHIAQIFS